MKSSERIFFFSIRTKSPSQVALISTCGNVLFVSDNAGDYSAEQMIHLKKYLKKTDEKILSAERLSDDVINIVIDDAGAKKEFMFDIKKGKVLKGE